MAAYQHEEYRNVGRMQSAGRGSRGRGGSGGGGGVGGGGRGYNQGYSNVYDRSNGYGGAVMGGRDYYSGGSRGRGFGNENFNNNRDSYRNNRNKTNGDEAPKKEYYIPPEPSEDVEEIFGEGITSGTNFTKYESIPVKVNGENVPTAIQSFDKAGLGEIILENVNRSDYKVPTPIQKAAIPIIQGGRDLMACAQTGSGKTAAFLVPIIDSLFDSKAKSAVGRPNALVVSPTRELTIQIFNEARKFSLGTHLNIQILYGGTSSKYQGGNIMKSPCHLLICTPGRLLDFLAKGLISFEGIRFVVLDEADRMLDMGFKDSVYKIMHHHTMPCANNIQTLMFSATFPVEIQCLAKEFLQNYIFVAVGIVGGACSDVLQNVYEVTKSQKRSKLMEVLKENPDGTIVFVGTKRSADFLASLLSETEFPTTSIHGDRLQSQREMALKDFKSGRMKVLIATSVAARGLDIKNVKHVVNYDMPASVDEYVHRIGRTGRVGNRGCATSFFDPDNDAAIASDLVRILRDAGQKVPEFLNQYSSSTTANNYRSTDRFGGSDVRKNVSSQSYYNVSHNNTGNYGCEDDNEDWNL